MARIKLLIDGASHPSPNKDLVPIKILIYPSSKSFVIISTNVSFEEVFLVKIINSVSDDKEVYLKLSFKVI